MAKFFGSKKKEVPKPAFKTWTKKRPLQTLSATALSFQMG